MKQCNIFLLYIKKKGEVKLPDTLVKKKKKKKSFYFLKEKLTSRFCFYEIKIDIQSSVVTKENVNYYCYYFEIYKSDN